MNEELEKLKLLAEKATPGDWKWLGGCLFGDDDLPNDDPCCVLEAAVTFDNDGEPEPFATIEFHHERGNADRDFIAAANPKTVLDLLSQIEESQWKPISEEPTVDGWYLVWYENCAVAWERRDGRYWLRTVADNWAESARNGKCWKRINPPEETLS